MEGPKHSLLSWPPFLMLVFMMSSVTSLMFNIPLHPSSSMTQMDVKERNSVFISQEKNLQGRPGQGYYIRMNMGQPPQQINVLVDTGSSNFAVAAAPHADITAHYNTSLSHTFTDLGTDVLVPYTQGNWHGHLGTDVMSLASLPNVTVRVNIACITSSDNFFINGSNWAGILGLAYASIARPDSSVLPFFESLVQQTDISNTFSLQLCGTVDVNSTEVQMGGTMIIGGVDQRLYEGTILYTPIRREWYYEVVILDMGVSGTSLGLDCKEYNFDKTIVDSGTTNLRLPQRVYESLKHQIKQNMKGVPPPEGFWAGDKVLCWDQAVVPWTDFPILSITLAGSHNSSIRLTISPQQYLRAVREAEEAEQGQVCFKFAVAQSDTGTVLGAIVIEGFYVIFDRDQKRIGFAKSTCPNRNPTAATSIVTGPFNYAGDTFSCAYIQPSHHQNMLITVAYIMAGICGAFVLLVVIQCQWNRCHRKQPSTHDTSNLLKDSDDLPR